MRCAIVMLIVSLASSGRHVVEMASLSDDGPPGCTFACQASKTAFEFFLDPCDLDKLNHYNFEGKGLKALVIGTSHDKMGDEDCSDCEPTGMTKAEASAAYYLFQDAGIEVHVASIKGGVIPDDGAPCMSRWDCRLNGDQDAWEKFYKKAIPLDTVDFTNYDIIWMVGGWGPSWDFGTSETLGKGVTAAFAAGKILGSVCHGALGFILATKPDGSLLVNGTRMTGVTDKQVKDLGIEITPMHPETELRKRGAVFESKTHRVTDLMASMVVIDDLTSDGRIITGQNQNSGCGTAQAILDKVNKDLGGNNKRPSSGKKRKQWFR